MARWILAGSLLLSAACVAPGAYSESTRSLLLARERARVEPGDEVVCANEMVTGSHIARPVCRNARDAEAQRFATQDSMKSLRMRAMHRGPAVSVDDLDMVVTYVHSP
jgi:hypothetical protein